MSHFSKIIVSVHCFIFLLCGTSYSDNKQESSGDDEQLNIELISEAFGHFIGRNLKSPGADFHLESVIKGIRNGAKGSPAPMSDQDYEVAMTRLQEQAFETIAKENLQAANVFLKKNKGEDGVVELEAGKLQYIVLKKGTGDIVEQSSAPLINYSGKYLDGTLFGSSEETGGPITIPLSQTIPGFSKGMVGMKEGEKRRLFIHPDLGYGTLGNLPPNALLVFDIEIVKANSESLAGSDSLSDIEEQFALIDEDDDSDAETEIDDDR